MAKEASAPEFTARNELSWRQLLHRMPSKAGALSVGFSVTAHSKHFLGLFTFNIIFAADFVYNIISN